MSALSQTQITLLVLQLVIAVGIFAACFYRLVKTNGQTVDDILLAFWFMAVAALLLLAAPFLPIAAPVDCPWPVGTTPVWAYLLFISTSLGVQITTAAHWVRGVPVHFMKDAS